MGIKNIIASAGKRAGNTVSRLSVLSPAQLEQVENSREKYFSQKPDPNDTAAIELTQKLLASNAVEIYNAYLPQISSLYAPLERTAEHGVPFDKAHNIRYFDITKWVTNDEQSLDKLVNVYKVLSNEDCNIALVFRRMCEGTKVYMAVVNNQNSDNNVTVNNYCGRLKGALAGNFPGSELGGIKSGTVPFLDENSRNFSVAAASNLPGEKSEKFVSQTIEKLLDSFVPKTRAEEYTVILLATPITDVEARRLALSEIYSGLSPYASWQTGFVYTESDAVNSSATIGVNVGASAGVQRGSNNATTTNTGETDSVGETKSESTNEGISDSTGQTTTDTVSSSENYGSTKTVGSNSSNANSKGSTQSSGGSVGGSFGISANATYSNTGNKSVTQTLGKQSSNATTSGTTQGTSKSLAEVASRAITSGVGKSVANTVGRALSNSVAKTAGVFQSGNFGLNFGGNFSRGSAVTATLGKNESITQTFTNHNIKHALELLTNQMKRFDQSSALGMWDFAAYVLSEEPEIAENVAHSYIALTQGEESYLSQSAINLWRGDISENGAAKELCGYLSELRHPLFGLNPDIISSDLSFSVYPALVTATTALSGRELSYSLNFPSRAVTGFPVLHCAEFGRNVVTYDNTYAKEDAWLIGNIFHMNHAEDTPVHINKNALASHTLITGTNGCGKSNTCYNFLETASENGIPFLVVEPAKGEYKTVFGGREDVFVYGTNPRIFELLKINPFSFPESIHILEHIDRLIEIFNVCWPMYAAMPAVLKDAIEKSYQNCGWNLEASKNCFDERIFPSFLDVCDNVRDIINQSEYDSENKGAYKGSLLTRLTSLTNGINGMVFGSDELSAEELFERNVIVDLSRVGSSETKSLIMGLLVLKLREHRIGQNGFNENLRHITVLEEAHNLLKRTSTEQVSEGANLLGKSVEMLSNSIAEMRSSGEGFIIVDQSPTLLDSSAIKNTNTKILMRLPDLSDRELAGKSANLNDSQITELSKLPRGVAAVYQTEWIEPVLCKVRKFGCENKPYTPTDTYKPDGGVAERLLLDCIMNNEIARKDGRREIIAIKDAVLSSNLKSSIKCDMLRYIAAPESESAAHLRTLCYNLFEAKKAIGAARDKTDISDWTDEVLTSLKHLNPCDYSQKQLDLLLALIIYEQTARDSSYKPLLDAFTEHFKRKGEIF